MSTVSSTKNLPTLSRVMVQEAVRATLLEDMGLAGDVTTDATIPVAKTAEVFMNCREEGIMAGMPIAEAAFKTVDPEVNFKPLVQDGDAVKPGQDIAGMSGPARSILSAERVALNYLCHLSGIATYTHEFASRISHTKAVVCCTRKTIPGMRAFEKYAVKCGGGSNHRYGLDDAILIKDNHVAVAGGVAAAVQSARNFAGHLVKIEIEVDTLEQLREALKAGPDVVMLDNMSLDELRQAVAIVDGAVPLEASGNVNVDTVKDIAETGVDMISTSKITMSAPTLDIGMDIRIR
ncbi:MAG: carboxylating nicotinate-nucleotide diphosphorylase [Rhizobiaceae bacterium]